MPDIHRNGPARQLGAHIAHDLAGRAEPRAAATDAYVRQLEQALQRHLGDVPRPFSEDEAQSLREFVVLWKTARTAALVAVVTAAITAACAAILVGVKHLLWER